MHFNLNFPLLSDRIISTKFREHSISDFQSACLLVRNLPYQRNAVKENPLCVLNDLGGTCSSKHAILRNLALENGKSELKLMLGIFKMNGKNTPKISSVLERYKLLEIPEAHNYLRFENEIGDFTSKNSKPEDFLPDLLSEVEISPDQITDFKIQFHKNFLAKYLQANIKILFSPDQFWKIREECIFALQQ